MTCMLFFAPPIKSIRRLSQSSVAEKQTPSIWLRVTVLVVVDVLTPAGWIAVV